MTEQSGAATQECIVFTRYLTGIAPTPYVIEKYRALQGAASALPDAADRLDRRLLQVAVRGPVRARIADAYARIFRPAGTLRRRLVLTFAILESSPGFHTRFTHGTVQGFAAALAGVAASAVSFLLCMAAGLPLFGPAHIAARREARAGD